MQSKSVFCVLCLVSCVWCLLSGDWCLVSGVLTLKLLLVWSQCGMAAPLQLHCLTNSTALHCNTAQCCAVHCIKMQCRAVKYSALKNCVVECSAVHWNVLQYSAFPSPSRPYILPSSYVTSRETAPVLISDIGGKTVLVLVHSLLLP